MDVRPELTKPRKKLKMKTNHFRKRKNYKIKAEKI